MKNFVPAVLIAVPTIAFVNPAGWVPSIGKPGIRHGRQGLVQTLKAQTLTLDVASSMIARPDKAARGGDDAYFVNIGDSGAQDLGVFDGVGGWASRGYDPGVFTRGFAKATAANITAQRAEGEASLQRSRKEGGRPSRFAKVVDLQQALEFAISNAAVTGNKGTCTACVMTFDPVYGMLNGLNIGDSGALLLRRDAQGTLFVALKTATQRHKFNQPYQLGTGSRDKARDAREFLFYVREGDLVVLATDGLLDNMFEADILRCVNEALEDHAGVNDHDSQERPVDLASALARRAFTFSRNKERLSPWEEEAVAAGIVPMRGSVNGSSTGGGRQVSMLDAGKWGLALERAVIAGMKNLRKDTQEAPEKGDKRKVVEEDMSNFRGGKMDDITVVVATVCQKGSRSGAQTKVKRRKNESLKEGSEARVRVNAQGR